MNQLHQSEITKIVFQTIGLAVSIGVLIFALIGLKRPDFDDTALIAAIGFGGICYGIGSLIRWR